MNRQPRRDEQPSEPPEERSSFDHVLGGVEAQYHEWEHQVREANDRIDQAAGRPLWQAIAVGLVFGGLFLVALLVSPLLFGLFAGVLLVFAVVELVGAMRLGGARLSRTLLSLISLAILAGAYFFGGDGLFTALFAGIILVALGRLVLMVQPGARGLAARDIQQGWFVLMYLPFMGSAAVALRLSEGGTWWIFAVMIIVVSVDTSAYAVGRALGRHKLAPAISPGKTWEGLAGATLAGSIAGVATGVWMIGVGPWWGVMIGLVIVITATLGDLLESFIKREVGVKDMSSLLPGHGGILDRLDSVLPSLAVGYLLYQFLG
ncbi:phosphatidate cytidylyltransferase [Pontimonas sp.]|uniref:phosphatidate cytidylyltransferase n=1 Tax=Pontimonas sp. TaxID=2304492 RepID=UPI002870331D|nr:phosphatidate cytidylyltransferase [Pontimonas sp.]MDR9396067.1 phosphatidate cytidylyltransferase [Pontimonas sp.]MDR9434373.1 phosphatidate cytidylyltransferase [Pontimonas sp.]